VIKNEHPNYPLRDWRFEVFNGDTTLGYKAWLSAQLEAAENVGQPDKTGYEAGVLAMAELIKSAVAIIKGVGEQDEDEPEEPGDGGVEPTDQALAVVASYLSNNGLNDDAAQAMCFQESTDGMMLEEILDLGYVPTRDELMAALAAHREFFSVTDKQRHILRHALGLTRSKREYRNHYVPGGEDLGECAALTVLGLMERRDVDWIQSPVYAVTERGKIEARKRVTS
jgi:hypothetical protein